MGHRRLVGTVILVVVSFRVLTVLIQIEKLFWRGRSFRNIYSHFPLDKFPLQPSGEKLQINLQLLQSLDSVSGQRRTDILATDSAVSNGRERELFALVNCISRQKISYAPADTAGLIHLVYEHVHFIFELWGFLASEGVGYTTQRLLIIRTLAYPAGATVSLSSP